VITRRDHLKFLVAAGASSAIPAQLLRAAHHDGLITRAVPKTGEELPIVGLGSSASFRQIAASDDVSSLRGVIKTLLDNGGTVFDTAPSYGASERVAGEIVQQMGATEKTFWATKVNVVPRGATTAEICETFPRKWAYSRSSRKKAGCATSVRPTRVNRAFPN